MSHRIENKFIPDACPQAQLQAFAVRRRTDAVMDKPFGNLPDQIFTVMASDDFQHHVKGADAAGRGEPCAIDDVNAPRQRQTGKGFGKGWLAAPMQRAGIAIKQPGPPEIEGAIRNASHMRAVAQVLSYPVERRLCRYLVRIAARANYNVIDQWRRARGKVGRNGKFRSRQRRGLSSSPTMIHSYSFVAVMVFAARRGSMTELKAIMGKP